MGSQVETTSVQVTASGFLEAAVAHFGASVKAVTVAGAVWGSRPLAEGYLKSTKGGAADQKQEASIGGFESFHGRCAGWDLAVGAGGAKQAARSEAGGHAGQAP